MTHRRRRFVAALLFLAALLFIGRWLALFLADRWWAAGVSPAAAVVLTRRALLQLGLELAGVVLTVLWFAAHAQVALNGIRGVPLREQAGNPAFRALVERPAARGVALSAALLLGILLGSGAGEWVDAVTLAGHNVTIGLSDPALGRDAGWYVTRLPLWLRLQAFLTVLVLLTLGLVLLSYLIGGAFRIIRGLAVTEEARAHLGLLLALLACTIGTSQILAPFQLAAGLPVPVASGVVELHRSVAFVLVGVSVAVAVLSIIWALRPLHSLVAGAWLALSAALVGAYYLLPETPPDIRDPDTRSLRREFERIAYGLSTMPRARERVERPVPTYWDEPAAARVTHSDSTGSLVAARGRLRLPTGDRPVWVALPIGADSVPVFLLADDTTGAGGVPLTWRNSATAPDVGLHPFMRLGPQAVRPGAPPVTVGSGPGVPAGGMLRRLLLVWARQSPTVIGAASAARVAWLLPPEERLRHIAPFAAWRDVRPWIEAGRLRWIAIGYVMAESFPMVRRGTWEGRPTAYLRAGFIGVVDAETGATEIYLRPGADPLARAWAASAMPMIRPTEQLPVELARVMDYPQALLAMQAGFFASDRAAAIGDTASLNPTVAPPRVVVGAQPGRYLAPIVDRRTGRVDLLLEGGWEAGRDQLWEYQPDSTSAPEAPDVLARRWQRFSLFQQIRDSVTAGGGAFETGVVRYAVTGDGLVAYQPAWGLDPRGRSSLLLITVASGDRLGVGRNLEEAWRSSRGELSDLLRLSDDAAARTEALRWLREADSALRRGDLVGFGRAFGALKAVLERVPETRPK